MSCWVVPTLAAELWSVPVEHVLAQVGAGCINAKVELGFMLVDVAPTSEVFQPARPPSPAPVAVPVRRARSRRPRQISELGRWVEPYAQSSASAPWMRASPPGSGANGELTSAELTLLGDGEELNRRSVEGMSSHAFTATASWAEPTESADFAGKIRPADACAEHEMGGPFHLRGPALSHDHSTTTFDLTPASDEATAEPEDSIEAEPDNGRPLQWRETRTRISAARRRPPRRAMFTGIETVI